MKVALISKLISLILGKIMDVETIKHFAGLMLNFAEKYVLGTASKVDDNIVLPICDMIRDTYSLKDYGDQKELLVALSEAMMSVLDSFQLKVWCDMVLDYAENYVLKTDSSIDDALILPLCGYIRKIFDIPDNDEPPEETEPIEPPK